MNELVQMFDNQEVKVKTDKGVTLINLAHTAKCCGLTTIAKSGNTTVRWKSKGVADKLQSIRCTNVQQEYIDEIDYILDEIENTDDRNSIYMSSWLSKRLAMECKSDKAMKYKNFLATLDEKREDLMLMNNSNPQAILQLAESMQLIGQVVQSMQTAMVNMQEFVKDSINSKDIQIEKTAEMIGLRTKNTMLLTQTLKDKLVDLTGININANMNVYKTTKNKIFKRFKVYKWEDVPIGEFNSVYAYIDSLEKDDIEYYK